MPIQKYTITVLQKNKAKPAAKVTKRKPSRRETWLI